MRIIKFRGKCKCINSKYGDEDMFLKWIYGDLQHIGNKYFIYHDDGSWYEVDKDTVGQFTGVNDKNGKEIYEGDIYNMGDKNIMYLVVWNDTGFTGKQIGSRSYAGLSHWKEKIEIIGNKYDNSKLI